MYSVIGFHFFYDLSTVIAMIELDLTQSTIGFHFFFFMIFNHNDYGRSWFNTKFSLCITVKQCSGVAQFMVRVFSTPTQKDVEGAGARRIPPAGELLQNHLRIHEHFNSKLWISRLDIKSFRMFTFTMVCWIVSLLTNIFIKIRLEKGRKKWCP